MSRTALSTMVSVVFAVLVLGVFYANRWHGPIGALERFFYAATRGDQETMRELMYPSDAPIQPERLVGLRGANNFNIVESRHVTPDLVWAVTLIRNPQYRMAVRVYYFMVRRPDGWKLDVRRTLLGNGVMVGP